MRSVERMELPSTNALMIAVRRPKGVRFIGSPDACFAVDNNPCIQESKHYYSPCVHRF
jgi:hypothetical protein